MKTKELEPPSVDSNQWNHVDWWHYCKPRKKRLAYRTDVRSFTREKNGVITTNGPIIECGTCGIKGTFVKNQWVPK